MQRLTAEWVRKAEHDYIAARKLSAAEPPVHEVVCFHCQQSAEKYLKALLQEIGLPVPRTHDLEDLLTLLLPQHRQLRSLRRGLGFLTGFAVETRYPTKNASKRQAVAALRWAKRVRNDVHGILGITSAKRRKKAP